MKRLYWFSVSTAALVVAISLNEFAQAAPPGIINHQGRIAVGGVNFDGTGYFKFALLNPDTPETFWTNDGTNTGRPGGEPTRAVPVTVSSGHYALLLGDTSLTNMTNAVPASLFESEDHVVLRIWFATSPSGPFEMLSPDRRLTPAPYSLHAAKADGVTDGSVTAVMLAIGSVTGEKIADGAITGLDSPDAAALDVLEIQPHGLYLGPSVSTGSTFISMVWDGDNAYSVDTRPGSGRVHSFDVSDPGAITLQDNQFFGESLYRVAAQGSHLYATALTTGGLNVFDVSDPTAIVFSDSDSTNVGLSASVAVEGDYAYVASRSLAVLQVFDVSNPANIVPLGSHPTDLDGSRAIAVQGDRAFVTNATNGGNPSGSLQIFDVSDPNNIILLGSDGTNLHDPRTVTVHGDYAYVGDAGSALLQIFDVSDAANIVPMDSDGTNLSSPRVVCVEGSLAFVLDVGNQHLQLFDVSDPAQIVPLDTIQDGLVAPSALAVQGTTALVGDASTNRIHPFNVGPRVSSERDVELVGGRLSIGTTNALADFHVEGDAFVSGSLLDSGQSAGGSGQVLSSSGAGTQWINLLDNDPTNELQSLSLSGDDLSLSGGNSVSLDQYLRTTGNQSYSGGTLDFKPNSTLIVDGALYLQDPLGLQFFAGAGRLYWEGGRIHSTIGMVIEGPIRVGTGAGGNFDYNDLSDGATFPHSSEMEGADDLFIGDDLEVASELFLSGSLKLNTHDSNQFIYFHDNGDPEDEFLQWNNGNDRFEFSNNLEINSGGNSPQLRLEQTSTSNFARLELATVDGGNWQIAAQSGASGSLRFYNGANRMILEDNGDLFIDGSLNPPSDRNKKENFEAVDPAEVLQKVAAMEINRWNYKHDDNDTPHLGPVAQDFHAAFGLGVDDKHIATVDADGIALAAIQGLNAKLEADNAAKDKKIAELEERLKALETLLTNPNSTPADHE